MFRRFKREKKQSEFSKFIVTLVVLLNMVFAGAVLFIYYKIGSEPAVLIGAWFAFTTGELFFLATIKKKEISKGGDDVDC